MNNHPYWKRSFLMKAINGFITYQICSWLSLIIPVRIDWALHKELTEQFKED
jgi:hypothetical protein